MPRFQDALVQAAIDLSNRRPNRPTIMVVPEFFDSYQITGRVWRGEETPLPTD